MSIIKVASKKAKSGYTYKVTFKYKEYGITQSYSKSGFIRKKDAQDHETQVKAQIKRDGYLYRECTKTLDEVYKEFLEVGKTSYQDNTIYNTIKDFKLIPIELKKKPIVKIDYIMLQRYFNSIGTKGLSRNKNIKIALNRIFVYAIKAKYITYNPISLVDVKGIEKKRVHDDVLSEENFNTLIRCLEEKNTFICDNYRIALSIGYYTGLRMSEVLALDKSDLDLDNDTIDINKKLVYSGLKKKDYYASNRLKSDKSKTIIPIAPPLKEILLSWIDEAPYNKLLCDIEGYYINPCSMDTRINEIAKKNGFTFNFHMLRHTFVTYLVHNNIDIKVVQELARHKDINTTMSVYTHLQENKKKSAILSVFGQNYSKNTPKVN